jgi:hypothetical protein
MEYELYESLQTEIKNQLTFPLYAEFIIWPEIQKHIAAEEFILSFQSSIEGEKWNKRNDILIEQTIWAKNLRIYFF